VGQAGPLRRPNSEKPLEQRCRQEEIEAYGGNAIVSLGSDASQMGGCSHGKEALTLGRTGPHLS